MQNLNVRIFMSLLLWASVQAISALPLYTFTGSVNQELSGTVPLPGEAANFDGAVAEADKLFAGGAAVDITFSYDAGAAADPAQTNIPGSVSNNLEAFGNTTRHIDAGLNVNGTVGGNVFSSTTADVFIADSDPMLTPGLLDGTFVTAGNFTNGNIGGSGFLGFMIDGYELISMNIITLSLPHVLDSQNLPGELLTDSFIGVILLNLVFENQQDPNILRLVTGSGQLSVPEPLTLSLMGIGFAGLGFSRRKFK